MIIYLKATLVLTDKTPVSDPAYMILEGASAHLDAMSDNLRQAISNKAMGVFLSGKRKFPYGDYFVSLQEISEEDYFSETEALEDNDDADELVVVFTDKKDNNSADNHKEKDEEKSKKAACSSKQALDLLADLCANFGKLANKYDTHWDEEAILGDSEEPHDVYMREKVRKAVIGEKAYKEDLIRKATLAIDKIDAQKTKSALILDLIQKNVDAGTWTQADALKAYTIVTAMDDKMDSIRIRVQAWLDDQTEQEIVYTGEHDDPAEDFAETRD